MSNELRYFCRWNPTLSQKEWQRRGSTTVVVGTGFGTTEPPPPVETTMLMGCSTSPNNHGGTEVWDGWRTYRRDDLFTYSNRTGNQRPKFMAFSEAGANLGGANPTYNSVYSHVRGELDAFFYTGAGSSTRSARWGIKLYWSNGNENADKGALEPHNRSGFGTANNAAGFVESQRALYDAVHYIDPLTNQRRYPDAFAGSNPTHYAEQKDIVREWLHPSAQYHDFVMWSMYPPGREQTAADPTYSYPSFSEANRTNVALGYMIRCFYRTKAAQTVARTDTGNSNFQLQISCGETGIGDDPDDPTTRPYFAVHGLAHGMMTLSAQYQLPMPFACWWDQELSGGPQNILTDEPTGLQVSTRQAWQNPLQYNHLQGGTHPSTWANNPKSAWKTTGPVI